MHLMGIILIAAYSLASPAHGAENNTVEVNASFRVQVTGEAAKRVLDPNSVNVTETSKSLNLMAITEDNKQGISLICKKTDSKPATCKIHMQYHLDDGVNYSQISFNLHSDPSKSELVYQNFNWKESTDRPGRYFFGCEKSDTYGQMLRSCGTNFFYDAENEDEHVASLVGAYR